MASDELWNAPDIVPSIMYTDLPRAIEWLERVLGFRERAEARITWPGGGMTWIEVGSGLFNIATPDETWRQDSSAAAPGVVMKVYVDMSTISTNISLARRPKEQRSFPSRRTDFGAAGSIAR